MQITKEGTKMRNYDDVEGFINYTSEDEWKGYIESYVIPLWKHSWILKEYWETLKNEFDGLPFDEVREEEKPLFLGGIVQRDEMYTRNSLAKFYAKFFGMKLKDIQSWILQSQTGEMLTEISVEVVETEFIKFVKEVFNLLDYGLLHQRLVTDFKEPELDYEELKNDPNKVKELIKNFYQGILNISLNYNYGTFFLCSINQITYRYMKEAYPRIDEALDFLKEEFGLIELEWNNPINPESEAFKDYTIYCFPEYDPNNKGKSFGGAICTLNDKIWWEFNGRNGSRKMEDALTMLFTNIPYLMKEYKKKVVRLLPKPLEYYRKSTIYYKGITTGGNECLLDVLDEMSVVLFLNLARIAIVGENMLEFDVSRLY